MTHTHRTRRYSGFLLAFIGLTACHELVAVSQPIDEVTNTAINSVATAEQELDVARQQVYTSFTQYSGIIYLGELLSDELESTGAYEDNWPVNARIQAGNEPADRALGPFLGSRAELLLSAGALTEYETGAGRARTAEAYALLAYTELFLGEDFCAGVPLSQILPQGGVVYGASLTTDSVLSVAESHFDSAIAYATSSDDDTIAMWASIGLGRTRLDRGNDTGADSAVQNVPTSFVYNLPGGSGGAYVPGPNFWEQFQSAYSNPDQFFFNVANQKGQVGLNFVTANDPRLVIDSLLFPTIDVRMGPQFPDSNVYYPVKFGVPSTALPLATGIEARLIQAEVALQGGSVSAWANDLNALRDDASDTHVTFANDLPPDSTTTASSALQVSVMFREKAFWLFGTGTRLGDMRRLIRQYGRQPNTVYSHGPYEYTNTPVYETYLAQIGATSYLPTQYGTDVSLMLPTAAIDGIDPNPNYKGCLTSASQA